MYGDSEGSALSEWLDDSADRDFRNHERERMEKLKRKERENKLFTDNIRKQIIGDLIALGVIPATKTPAEYVELLSGASKKSRAVSTQNTGTALYMKAQSAKQGDQIKCPACGNLFIKKSYNNIFCSNQKHKKGRSCKDDYHNGTRIA